MSFIVAGLALIFALLVGGLVDRGGATRGQEAQSSNECANLWRRAM